MTTREFRQRIADLLADSRRREADAERITERPPPSKTKAAALTPEKKPPAPESKIASRVRRSK